MPPLNFERLKIFVEDVQREGGVEEKQENEAGEWMNELVQYEIEDEEDVGKLQALFKATKIIMEYQSAQASAAMEEAEEQGKAVADLEDKLESERGKYKEELSELRMELAGGAASSSTREGGGQEVKTLMAEIQSLREENENLMVQNRQRDIELADATEKYDRILSKMTDLEREAKDERSRRFELENTVQDLKRRTAVQQEGQAGRRVETEDMQKKVKERSDQLVQLSDEVINLTQVNDSLRSEVDKLKNNLVDATKEMNKTSDMLYKLKDALRAADETVEVLEKENKELKKQIESPKEEQASAYDELMAAVDKKIEEWKGLLQAKDKTIELHKAQVEKLQQEIIEFSIDTDRASVAALTKAIEDRDKQINVLKEQLEKATTEMDKTVDMIESLQSHIHGEGGASALQKRMVEMASILKEREKKTSEAMDRAEQAEKAAADRDTQMSDIIARLRQYEKGEYGLTDAVDELNRVKTQLQFRDKQIGELTRKCSKLETEMHEVTEENEGFRDRLGLDKRKGKKKQTASKGDVQKETDRALNVILTKEIERLEDERLEMKLQLRKMSQKLGQRAVALGLSADDLVAVEQFTEELRHRRGQAMEEWKQQIQTIKSKVSPEMATTQMPTSVDSGPALQNLYQENVTLRTKIGKVETENLNLIQALKEIRSQIDEKSGDGEVTISSPALDTLLMKLASKDSVSKGDLGYTQESRVKMDRLVGQNEELRSELHKNQSELIEAKAEALRASDQIAKVEEELSKSKTRGFQTVQLPEGLPVTSSMLIMNLNEHLIQLLQENGLKSEQLTSMENSMQAYGSKIAVLKHSQGLLYKDYWQAQRDWEAERDQLRERYTKMDEKFQSSQIKLQEYDRLLDTLDRDESEARRRLSEMTRKFTVMRINEAIMIRKYQNLEKSEKSLKQEQDKLMKDTMRIESMASEKMAYLRHQKDMGSFEIASLHKTLSTSVSESEFENVKQELQSVTEKYRKLMEHDSKNMQTSKFDADLQLAYNRLQKEHEHIQKLWQTEKEKTVKYEAILSDKNLLALPEPVVFPTSTDEKGTVNLDYLSKRVALLEMKELNECQRAEHAQQMYEKQRDELRLIEERNLQLERKVEELGEHNLKLQKDEQKLRDELNGCVTNEIHKMTMERIAEVELTESKLRAEIDGFKSVAEVAQSQMEFWQKNDKLHTIELDEYKSCIRNLQAETDQKTIIGRLYRELVHMKLADTDTQEQLKIATTRIRTLETQLLRAEQRYDMKERALQHLRIENVHRVAQLRKTIEGLRMRFSGAVSLKELEKLHRVLTKVNDDRIGIRKELVHAIESAEESELHAEELKLRQSSLEELISTLKEGDTAKRVAEWHQQLEQLRLKEMRLSRTMKKVQNQLGQKEEENEVLESAINALEEGNVKMTKEAEERQLRWEIRENDLEFKLNQYMSAERWEDKQLADVQRDKYGMPDPSLPLAIQLDQTIVALRKQLNNVSTYRKENEIIRKANEDLTNGKRRLETQLLASERMSSAQLQSLSVIPGDSMAQISVSDREDLNRAMRMMNATVDALKAQLAQKDDAAEGYRKLVETAQKELAEAESRHQLQLSEVKDTIFKETELRLAKLKEDSNKLLFGQNREENSDDQLMKIADLQVDVEEFKNANSLLVEKLKEVRFERDRLQAQLVQQTVHSSVKSSIKPTSPVKSSIQDSKSKADQAVSTSKQPTVPEVDEGSEFGGTQELSQAVDKVQEDLSNKESKSSSSSSSSSESKSPTPTAATVTGRSAKTNGQKSTETKSSSTGRVEAKVLGAISNKEKQHALELKVKCDRLRDQLNSKEKENQALTRALGELKNEMMTLAERPRRSSSENGLKELEIKELKRKISDLEEIMGKRSRDVKRGRNREEEMISDLQELKGELARKDGIVSRLRLDKASLEKENDNLERRITHLRESVKMKLQESENRELRKKVTSLEKQLEINKTVPAEKPLEYSSRSGNGVAKWEETKKWQRTCEKLKERLNAKLAECEGHDKMISRLKERINRLEQEKLVLSESQGSPQKQSHSAEMLQLRKENEMLQNEVRQLTTRLVNVQPVTDHSAFTQLQAENLRVNERCAALEAQLHEAQTTVTLESHTSDVTLEIASDTTAATTVIERVLKETENDKRRLEAELVQVKIEKDEMHDSFESLHDQIRSLQRELTVLQKEKPRGSAIETVNRLHTTVEQLETENSQLKQQLEEIKLSSARLSDPELKNILRENKDLRDKLNKTVPRVAWAEQLKFEKQDKAVEKLATENHRLGRELRKEQYENEVLREEVTELRANNEQLQQDIRRMEQLNLQKRKWHPNSGMSSVVAEEKLKAKSSILQHKEARIYQLEHLLQTEVEKNQTLLFENKRLKNKLTALEWTVPKSETADDLVSRMRHIKSELTHMEGENEELKTELEVLNRHIKPAVSGTDVDIFALKERLKNYERVLKENIELKLEKNALLSSQCPYCDGRK